MATNVKVDIAAEFVGKKAFNDAIKSTIGLNSQVKSLAKSYVGLFTVQRLGRAGFNAAKAFAADDKAAKIAEAANKEIQSITERYDQEIKLAQAAGKETIDLEIKKQKAIRDTAYLQVRSLLALSKEREGLNEEQQKQLEEFVKITSDAVNTIDVLETQKHTGLRSPCYGCNKWQSTS